MRKVFVIALSVIALAVSLFAQDSEGIKIGKTNWKLDGEIRFMYTDQTDPSAYGEGYYYDFGSINRMYQRYRLGITAEFSPNLLAYYKLQVGDEEWGNSNYNEREINVRSLYAYLQYKPDFIEGLTFTAGLQPYDDIFLYSVWSDEGVGIIANYANDKMTTNMGFLTLRDEDVDADATYLVPAATTFAIFDMKYQLMDTLSVKSAFYYEDHAMREDMGFGYLDYKMIYYGLGVDYKVIENVNVGGHFVINDGTGNYETSTWDIDGYFAYGYASYEKDKFFAKFNYGYTPYDRENPDEPGEPYRVTSWRGAFSLLDLNGTAIAFARGNQWMSGYGLEYFGRGDVCDRMAMANYYGYWPGLMVMSVNVAYDFAFANFGIMKHTYEDGALFGWDDYDKTIGTEFDFGIKTHVMEGLEFKAVYAMFITGDFWKFGYDEAEVENAHELSMQLLYTF